MTILERTTLAAGGLVLGLLAGCSGEPGTATSSTRAAASAEVAALPAGLFVESAPDGARGVAAVKADASATEAVVVRGRIGGRAEPFLENSAVFVIVDPEIKSCAELHADACKTPWDYCCEPKESLLANVATVQVVDADGRPLAAGLAGQHGLAPLRSVTIAGTVSLRDAGTLVIDAQRIHVAPEEG